MSWPLAAFAVLAVGLGLGFAWYERERPSTRVVALVGTLAAFASLGRIAFAPLPNVKPTTDIVLITGFVLGGAPGFVVGALAALSSNFFFGQGPWTPWQMAGWGIVGLIGALLALAAGRRVHRVVLAAICGVVGFGFTSLQDFGDWVTYSDHSFAQLGVYVGKGVGFDLVHAFACVSFALLFGPGLIAALARFTRRTTFTWTAPAAGPSCLLLVAAMAAVAAVSPPARAAVAPVQYLLHAENGDGGFGAAPGEPSSSDFSGWTALGLAAAGARPPQDLIAYLEHHPGSDPGSLERTLLALRGAAVPPLRPLVTALRRDFGGNGAVSRQVNLTAFGIMALRAAGSSVPPASMSWLARQQDADGGFGFTPAPSSSDVDDTGAVLEALAAGGFRKGEGVVDRAVRFIEAQRNGDGGFPSQPGGNSNAQSTAWAIQGLLAVGAGSTAVQAPLRYLRSLIAGDGHIRYAASQDQTPVWVTAEALMALAERPLPLLTPLAQAPPPAAPGLPPPRTTAPRAPRASPRPHGGPGGAVVRRVRRHRMAHRLRLHRRVPLEGLARVAGAIMAVALAPAGI